MKKDILVKVCGLAEPENIKEVDSLGIDFIGMIFYPKSPRYIIDKIKDKETFHSTLSNVYARKTGVFVNENIKKIIKYSNEFNLDYIQLHGDETPEFCSLLKDKGYKIMKAFNIKSPEDFSLCEKYTNYVDYFIFDTPCSGYGGSGKKFNWEYLKEYNLSVPFLLSGGIGRGDDRTIAGIEHEQFSGIDLNSKFELEPAFKDVMELDDFISKIRVDKVMNRIDKEFLKIKQDRVSVYFTAGFPNLNSTKEIVLELDKQGADMIEIGIPFSDPLADGVVIQESSTKALNNGMSLDLLFAQLNGIRENTQIPLILMGYLNPILQYGIERFCESCVNVGIDGVIIPDLPFDEYLCKFKALADRYDLKFTMLITPETPQERVRLIDKDSNGFIYMVSTASTTGAKNSFSDETIQYFDRINSMNLQHPRMIGFGISNPETYNQANKYSSGAIIGSSFIKLLKNSSTIADAVTGLMQLIGRY